MWTELTEVRLRQRLAESHTVEPVYFYTPTCGNCRVARRILDLAIRHRQDITIVACNLNMMPRAAAEWQITRVPALLLFKQAQVVDRYYDFTPTEAMTQRIDNLRR